VKYSGEAEARGTEEARVGSELLERTRSGAEERCVGDALMGRCEGPELLGQREGEKEVRYVEPPRRLLDEPEFVLGGLALWTAAVAAGTRRLMRAAASRVVSEPRTKRRSFLRWEKKSRTCASLSVSGDWR
jgi:hypothetical protein